MNIDEIYSGSNKYLRAADLQGNRVVVTISDYTIEEMKSDEGNKKQVVLHFDGKEKVLGLNKTNAERIAAHVGSKNPDDWIGCKIKLYPSKTQFQGREVDCIRVSEEFFEANGGSNSGPDFGDSKPKATAAPSRKPAPVEDDDEIPF